MLIRLSALAAFAVVAACSVAPPALAGATVQRGVIEVNGKPFFPVMLLDQCGDAAAANATAVGANVVLDESCPTPAGAQLRSLAPRHLGVVPMRGPAVLTGNALGWTFPDEPENNGWSPERLARAFRLWSKPNDGRLTFLTATSSFLTTTDGGARSRLTAAFARLADVPGFDLYPLNHCRTDLSAVYDAQRRFARLAPGKPTFQWIETGAIEPGYCGGLTVLPAQVTAEAWLAVAGGARAIGFFTQALAPTHEPFSVSPPVRQAMRTFAQTAAAIRPGLTGTTTASHVDTPAIRVLARVGGGRTFVVAVNTLSTPVPAQFSVPRLRNGTLTVVGESRAVPVAGGRFADTFAPLGVHVYETG